MYPQFIDGHSMRGVPDPSRSPVRPPFMNYYGTKLPDGMHYGGMPPVPRLPNPYSGKPDHMYGGHPNWNPMMVPQHYGVSKPPINKPEYQFTGQEHMYGRMYNPDLVSYSPGFVPPGQQYQHAYLSPSHHFPGGDGNFHDSYSANMTPQHNDHWQRQQSQQQQQQQQQQPSVVINDGTASDGGSPAPRTSVAWGPSGELLTPDQTKPLRPSVSPRNSPGLHKESSVSSLKEALLSGSQIYNEGKTNSSLPPGPGLGPGSNLGPSPGMVRSPVLGTSPGIGPSPVPVSRVSYPGNSSPFLGMSEVRDRSSPMTPNMVIPPGQTQTPRLSSPVGIIEPNDSTLLAPPPQQPTPPIENRAVKSPFDNINSSTVTRQPSPFEMDSILGGLKENEPRNGKTVSPINNNDQINSPVSSIGASSPRLRKVRMSPNILSPVDRNHPTFANQYNLSKEPGRKDFLDALIDHLLKEGIPLLRVPTVCKTQLDLYKSFTSVQQLGGFRHVVEKRLWKDVLKSYNPLASSSTSPALRLLQEYYIKVLLPYECHISNTSLQDCLTFFEQKGSPVTANNNSNSLHDGGDTNNITKTGPGEQSSLPNNSDSLMPAFSEEPQNSLDGNQPLPDISVQEAEFVLGIPPSSNQATPQSSFPPNANWSDFIPNQPAIPSADERTFQSPIHPHVQGHPGMGGGDPSFMFPPYNDQFNDYRNHMSMSQYMNRHPYMGNTPHPSMQMDPGGYAPPHYSIGNRTPQDPHYGSMEWQWNQQQRPRLPPPLPAHLQSMSFQIPHSSSHVPLPPVPQPTSRSSTPQGGGSTHHDRASPSIQPNLEPIKIHWQDQQPGNRPNNNRNVGGRVMTPPLSQSQQPVATVKESVKDEQKRIAPTTPKVPEQTKVSRPSVVAPSPPVEMTEPYYRKRRKLSSDNCGQVEPWRVMMSLKSGLAPDSTWALDTLSILLHDDRTVGFFYLKHHHSLLNTLVDHLTVCLHDIFGDLFQLLPKYVKQSDEVDSFGRPHPVKSSVYHMTKTDVQMGKTDLLLHVHSYFKMNNNEESLLDLPIIPAKTNITCKSTGKNSDSKSNPDILRVDETPLNDLLKRDALGERILFHLKTPRRVMVCSPIQKFFPPNSNIPNPMDCEENEVLKREPTPLVFLSEERESLVNRCLTLSNVIRSLSFIPGNDVEFSQHIGLLVILGKLLLFCHSHLLKPPSCTSSMLHNDSQSTDTNKEEERDDSNNDHDDSSSNETPSSTGNDTHIEWWWDCLQALRENVFVILANIAGQLDLSIYSEAINYPLLDGLLHWLVCPSSMASDPLPDSAVVSFLSPQRLVLEALAKISISEVNVDYILATPTLPRLDLVYNTLLHFISHRNHPASKQFALVFLSNLAQGNEGASRMIGQQKMAIPLLLQCLESAETLSQQMKSGRVAYNHSAHQDDPTSLSIAMLRRTAITLHCIARVHLNRVSFLPYCKRLLALVMSTSLDPSLTGILSDVLFELNRIA